MLEQYIGRKLTYLNGKDEIDAEVIMADDDIGLTITSVDRTQYLFCLRGPLSPQGQKMENYPYDKYKRALIIAQEFMDSGYWDAPEFEMKLNGSCPKYSNVDSSKCAFGN